MKLYTWKSTILTLLITAALCLWLDSARADGVMAECPGAKESRVLCMVRPDKKIQYITMQCTGWAGMARSIYKIADERRENEIMIQVNVLAAERRGPALAFAKDALGFVRAIEMQVRNDDHLHAKALVACMAGWSEV